MDYCLEYEHLKDENHVFKSINYDELMDLFSGFNSGLVYIGGPWCKNCQAVISFVNTIAKHNGISTVYNFDPKFINVFKEEDDLRDCKTLEVKLNYYYLVEKLGFKSSELVVDTLIPRMHVPFFFVIKNGSCNGYYSCEYVFDKYLHLENDDEDKTNEFVDSLTDLINNL